MFLYPPDSRLGFLRFRLFEAWVIITTLQKYNLFFNYTTKKVIILIFFIYQIVYQLFICKNNFVIGTNE